MKRRPLSVTLASANAAANGARYVSSIIDPNISTTFAARPGEMAGRPSTASWSRTGRTFCSTAVRGSAAANPKATRAPADAISANVARHPDMPPIQAPAGTPNAIAPVTPNATAATARPAPSGGASLATVANRAGVAVAAARAATIRKAIRTGNAGLTAAPALAAVKTSAAETRTVLRGARAVATAASGAATATVTEKTVPSCPAVPTLTSRERAISGSTPAIT